MLLDFNLGEFWPELGNQEDEHSYVHLQFFPDHCTRSKKLKKNVETVFVVEERGENNLKGEGKNEKTTHIDYIPHISIPQIG